MMKILLKNLALILIFNFFTSVYSYAQEKVNFKLGVNRFAWYASLQTINFMPLISADPFSGIILTDWYSINNNEKYKIDIYILEELLTSNTIQVKVFKKVKSGNNWIDAKVSPTMGENIEDSILNLSRKLRIEHILGQ